MIQIESVRKGDYLVVRTHKESGELNKAQLIKVTMLPDSELAVTGVLQDDPHLNTVTVTAKDSEILVNLGKKPSPGKVYGYDLAKIFRGSKEHDEFGEIHFFTRPDEKNMASFWKGLDRSAALLKKHGLGFLKDSNFVFEVVPKNGKYSGMYYPSSNIEKKLPKVQVSVGDDTIESASIGSYAYVILHELGHALDFQYLSTFPGINSSWLNVYSTSIGPRSVSKERAQELLRSLVDGGESMKSFFADLDEDGKQDFRLCLKWIREIKRVNPADLSTLLECRSDLSLSVLTSTWPSVNVRSNKLNPVVTEYACKSRRELFAESFAFYLLGKELPAKVHKLVEKSISLAKGRSKVE